MLDSVARKTKVLEKKATTVGGWPAYEMTIQAPLRPDAAPSKIAILFVYADQNFYQIRVFGLKPGTEPKDVRKFFDAFKLKKVREGKQESSK